MAIDWNEIRSEYEAAGQSVRRLAAKHGIKADSIKRRAVKESWKKASPAQESSPALPSPVKGEEKRKGSSEPEAKSSARRPRDISQEHRKLWKGVKKRLVSGLRSADLKAGLEELKVAKVAGEVLSSVIKGEREAWGLDEGSAEKAQDNAGDIIAEMDALTVPHGTDETVE